MEKTGKMEEHRRLLERAAGGQLPESVDDQSTPEFGIFRELIKAGDLEAIDVSSHSGGLAYLKPRITMAGRERLSRLTSEASMQNRREILEIKPGFMGFKIDVKALFRWIMKWWSSNRLK